MLLRIFGGLLLLIVAAIAFTAWSLQPLNTDAVEVDWMTRDDRFVTVDGERWRVRESGPENAPAVVLIHGFSHSLEVWEAWSNQLDDRYRIIRFDLPGHGLTGPRTDGAYGVGDTVAQINALFDEIAPERFTLGGHSLGGLLAWRYTVDHPDRVSGLILVSPGGYPNPGMDNKPVPAPSATRAYLTRAHKPDIQTVTATLYADPSRVTSEQLDRIRAMLRVEGNGPALMMQVAQFTLPDPVPMLSRITTPALIIWGDSDTMIPPTHGPRFDAALTNSRLLLIRSAGHMAMEEQPEITARAVLKFLTPPD